MTGRYDLAVVGAGIVGLAHALAATRQGLRTIVIDRDAQANGASIRNFGFVTVTGQEAGTVWRWARRSRDVWLEIAEQAGIAVEQRGMLLVARRPEAATVCHAFLQTGMAEGCRWLDGADARAALGGMAPAQLAGVLASSADLRVDSRTAIPNLARYLAAAHGVVFRRGVAVHAAGAGRLDTSAGTLAADRIVVCPGTDRRTLFSDALAGVTTCKLQMLRLASPGFRLPATVMSDLSLVRYSGYAALPPAAALLARLTEDQPDHLANGVHLIVTQDADGSLIVGDSHHYAETPDPFASEAVDALILNELRAVFGCSPRVLERWTGFYTSAGGHSRVVAPASGVRVVVVTSGTGASTAFALAEEVIADLIAGGRA